MQQFQFLQHFHSQVEGPCILMYQ